jgi:Zn-finger nucleic acid-binding protein
MVSKRHHSRVSVQSPDPDPISLDHFPMSRGVWLNKKIYNATHLSKMLKAGQSTVPHTRRPLTFDEIDTIMYLSGRRLKNIGTYADVSPKVTYGDYQSRRRAAKNKRRPF